MVGFPYTYGDIKDIDYEIKWVKNLVLKKTVHQTYKITQIISKYGLVKKVRIIFVIFVFVLGLSFASLEPVELIIQEKTQIERQIVNSSLAQAIESSKNTSATSIFRGGDLGKGSSPGARAKSNPRAAVNKKVNDGKALKSKPGRKGVAEALTLNSFNIRRPAVLNCLLRKFQPRPTLDPYNPGCAGGPRSITVLSGQSNANSPTNQPVREITAHDGVKDKLSDKSLSHLTSKHADAIGIDDPLPILPNQKATKYKQVRTRINKENKKKFGDTLEKILEDPNTKVFPEISMRGIAGHGYYIENYGECGFFIGISTEDKLAGYITKAQPISEVQLKVLQEKNKIN
jgi:hypothetical protein